MVENEVNRVDKGSIEIVVAEKVEVVAEEVDGGQGIQELMVDHMVTLVHRVNENEGQSETGNQ